jgi:hypothetical protein
MLFRATSWIALLLPVLQAGCATHEPLSHNSAPATLPATDSKGRPALAENLDARAFKAALVGEWVSVWTSPNGRAVKHMTIHPNGMASVTFVQDKMEQTVEGTYSVAFCRPPSKHAVTLADVTIAPSVGKPIVLSRVNFGPPGSAVLHSDKIVLHIDETVLGGSTLTRAQGK